MPVRSSTNRRLPLRSCMCSSVASMTSVCQYLLFSIYPGSLTRPATAKDQTACFTEGKWDEDNFTSIAAPKIQEPKSYLSRPFIPPSTLSVSARVTHAFCFCVCVCVYGVGDVSGCLGAGVCPAEACVGVCDAEVVHVQEENEDEKELLDA
jgi:hypothetical protein